MGIIEKSIFRKTDGNKNFILSVLTLGIYSLLLGIVMYYHEPWFDEAQAWLIARDATFGELFGSITHYEGHPPIWFLILMPFAKSGMEFEVGIKIVNFILATSTAGMIIFRAPFRLYIRCIIPFTYFFFYQYGVISRPYSVMMIGFVLAAICYKERAQRPLRFVACLLLICSSSAYGMLISAGIVLIWMTEGIKKDKKFISLSFLLVYNIMLLLLIRPFKDTYAVCIDFSQGCYRILYMLFMAPADAICSYGYGGSILSLSLCIPLTLIIYYLIFSVLKPVKKRSLFFIPYLMFSVFSGLVYFSVHHLGIIVVFILFVLWITADEYRILNIKAEKVITKIFRYPALIFITASIGISIFWSAAASFNDINFSYGTGRGIAEFINRYKLEDRNILASWHLNMSEENQQNNLEDYNFVEGIPVQPYFKKNLYYNLNSGNDNKCYLSHRINTDREYIKNIISDKSPEILIGNNNQWYTFDESINMKDYITVSTVTGHYIWKDQRDEYRVIIYMRRDIAAEYGFFE